MGRIVEGTGTAVGRHAERGPRSKDVQEAMAAAVRECLECGVTDPDEIRAAQLEARKRVLASA